MKISKTSLFLLVVYLATIVLWLFFVIYTGYEALYEGNLYTLVLKPFLIGMTILPLAGGFLGVLRAKKWGGLKSAVGRGILALSFGLFAWGLGMIVWNYYLFSGKLEIPYPSLGDFFYILIWPLWTYGMIEIARVSGARFGLRNKLGRSLLFIIPIVVIILSYFLLFSVARNGIIEWDNLAQLILGVLYPLGDVLILSSAMVVFFLSRNFLGGIYHKPIILLLFGFVLNYVADFIFVYTTTNGTYFNGNIADFLYVNMIYIVSLGILMLDPIRSDDYPT